MQKKTSQFIQSIFDVNHPMLQLAERLFDLLILNILTVLVSLPIVTIGLAKLALQASLWDMKEKGKIKVLQTYWKHLSVFWKRGLLLSLLEIGITGFCLLDLYLIWGQRGIVADSFRVLCIAVLIFSQLLWVYLYPLATRLNGSIKDLLLHSILWMGGQAILTLKVSFVYLLILVALLYSDLTLLIGLVYMACFAYAALSYLFIKALVALKNQEN